jgi:hypothetical protein
LEALPGCSAALEIFLETITDLDEWTTLSSIRIGPSVLARLVLPSAGEKVELSR